MTIGLEAVVSFLPDKVLTLADREHLRPYIPPLMEPPKERRQCLREDAAEYLAVACARKALERAGRAAAEVDLLMVQQIGGRYVFPGVATCVHHALGMPRAAPAWNIQTICASFIDGCRMAAALVRAGTGMRRVLLITVTASETGGWGTDQSDATAAAMGDAAGAAVISDQGVRLEILSYANETHNVVYDALPMALDAPAHPEILEGRCPLVNRSVGPRFSEAFLQWLTTTGRRMIVTGFRRALDKAGLQGKDIDYVVLHQAFLSFLGIWMDELHAALGVRREALRETWDLYGNTGACDVPVSLAHVLEHERVAPGAVIAMFGPGGGGHTPTMLLRRSGAA
jgi:3-oxoacyl-[acyl-carrier-protein] synthase-3